MSEKRFNIENGYYQGKSRPIIYDDESSDDYYFCGDYEDFKSICKQFNDFDNDIKYLKQENKRLIEHLKAYQNSYKSLKEELKEIYDIATLTKAIKLVDEIYDKYAELDPSDRNAELKRKAIIECSDKIRGYREELRYL